MFSILITGGAGFFGTHFISRLLKDGLYERICVYSRCEHRQATLNAKLNNDTRLRWFIGDVRDYRRLKRACEGVDTVVHAAALKRIEVGHYNPQEMIKTNVIGAMNVVDACMDAGVKKAVMLSTDKAFQPVSPYGQSKAMAESLFLNANECRPAHGTRYAVVRYGNVAGATGSVIPRWRELLKGRDAVPVSDPQATRFWMWPHEAVDLVLSAIDTMPEAPLIPQLPAYTMADLAEAMGAKIHVVGMPPWEKKHESMKDGLSSDCAPRLSVAELRERLKKL